MITLRKVFLIATEVFISLMLFVDGTKLASPPVQGNAIRPSNFPIEMPKVLPCPNPFHIDPCQCSFDDDHRMLMDCSNITSEEELKTIFSQEFPFPDFHELKIDRNKNLEALRSGDLGNASFVSINLNYCSLSELEGLALVGSHDTLQILDISYNSLQCVPNISDFKKLTDLRVYKNALKEFPVLVSSTVDYVDLGYNQIEIIPDDAIYGLPSLKTLYLNHNSISHILSGTFANNDHLNYLRLSDNTLSTIPQNGIVLHGDNSKLYLDHNYINHIPEGSFSGVTYWMNAFGNSLTHLDEAVWRPLLEDNVRLEIEENDFECGCDIAWLILNRTLLERVYDRPRCDDSEAFVDLDPAIYEDLC